MLGQYFWHNILCPYLYGEETYNPSTIFDGIAKSSISLRLYSVPVFHVFFSWARQLNENHMVRLDRKKRKCLYDPEYLRGKKETHKLLCLDQKGSSSLWQSEEVPRGKILIWEGYAHEYLLEQTLQIGTWDLTYYAKINRDLCLNTIFCKANFAIICRTFSLLCLKYKPFTGKSQRIQARDHQNPDTFKINISIRIG